MPSKVINDSLIDPHANDPDNLEDKLPMPYSLINEVLNETILFQLNLKMHQIDKKKDDPNYEGPIREYVSQTTLDIEGISCLSQPTKSHNHLLAGDKSGNIYLLDLAKKTVFSKKQLVQGNRTLWITDSIITDGQNSITTAAIIFHNHPTIYILRYKQSQPKLFLTNTIKLGQSEQNISKLPYHCQFYDHSRMLSVKSYDGSIKCYRIPELIFQIDKFVKATPIPLEEEQIKKILKYPLKMAIFQQEVKQIKESVLELEFMGVKPPPKYSQMKNKFMSRPKKPVEPEQTKKDPKKDKKVQQIQQTKQQIPLKFNKVIQYIKSDVVNGVDQSPNYPLPQYEPFIFFIDEALVLPKSKYFQKAKSVSLPKFMVYGWTNTKTFRICRLKEPSLCHNPEYLHLAYFQARLGPENEKHLASYHTEKLQVIREEKYQNVHEIKVCELSQPDQTLVAFGLKNGTVSIWNILTKTLQFNTNKHTSSVTALKFFEQWKLVSGSKSGEVYIHNVVSRTTDMKRTNTFQAQQAIPITSISINELGVAYALDDQSNLRVYDLWRNQKIAKFSSCHSHAILQKNGKKWLNNSYIRDTKVLYTNRDFTVVISINWPNFTQRVQDRTEEEQQRMKLLKENPWKSKGTNMHIIRNFQYLLYLFEGLQSIYKRGYERRKVENLFTNLQFTQLNDRTFQIPDFGKPVGLMTKKASNTNNKSLFSGMRNSEKSLKSSQSKSKSIKETETNKEIKLTNEVLHPEKFLLERRKINKGFMMTSESLVDQLRKDHGMKEARESKLITDNSKSLF